MFFSPFHFPFAILLANMGVVCIGWWALHTADSIMLSDALLQLHVLMLKKRAGREEGSWGGLGGGWGRDAYMLCLISVRCTCVNTLVRMFNFFSNSACQQKGGQGCSNGSFDQQFTTIEICGKMLDLHSQFYPQFEIFLSLTSLLCKFYVAKRPFRYIQNLQQLRFW